MMVRRSEARDVIDDVDRSATALDALARVVQRVRGEVVEPARPALFDVRRSMRARRLL